MPDLPQLLAESEGFDDPITCAEHFIIDSVCPGICPECEYTTHVEPDQDAGWCEECDAGTVQSLFILLGII